MNKILWATMFGMLLFASESQAQGRIRAATEAAEWLIGRFGAKAGRTAPALAGRIEKVAARYGDDAILVTGSLYTAGAARPILQRSAN